VLLVARDLGISKNTVYLHIRPLKKNGVSVARYDVPEGEQGLDENE
jgi:biotin operon repressor